MEATAANAMHAANVGDTHGVSDDGMRKEGRAEELEVSPSRVGNAEQR